MANTKNTNARTGEKKLDFNDLIEKGKKGNLTGDELDLAIEELDLDMDQLDKLSAKVEEITDKVNDKIAECENLKAELAEAKNQLFSYWAESVDAGDVGFMEKDGLSSGEIQRLCSKLNEKCPTACVVAKQADGTSKICLFSSVCDTNKVGRAICTALGGKGGGKPGIFQGTFSAEGDVLSLLKGALND